MAVENVTGAETVWYSDIDPGASKILAHNAPGVPNHGDLTRIDWAAVEPVDIVTGGFPCQDLSLAGKRRGMAGARSGLWSHMATAIDILRPALVVAENVRGLLSAEAISEVEPCPWCVGDGSTVDMRALGAVLADLADLGYDAAWHGLTAASVGAPHGRFRVFVTAWPAENTDRATRGERWESAPGQAEGGRARADVGRRSGTPTPDPDSWGLEGRQELDGNEAPNPADRYSRGQHSHGHSGSAAPDPESIGRLQGWAESAGQFRGSDAAERGDATPADTDNQGLEGHGQLHATPREDQAASHDQVVAADTDTNWGEFGPAIRQWANLIGRPAPRPTNVGTKGGHSLAPQFVEWMMGLPLGHVTGVPNLTRNEQLKALGNGVVPQQAEAALRILLPQECAA